MATKRERWAKNSASPTLCEYSLQTRPKCGCRHVRTVSEPGPPNDCDQVHFPNLILVAHVLVAAMVHRSEVRYRCLDRKPNRSIILGITQVQTLWERCADDSCVMDVIHVLRHHPVFYGERFGRFLTSQVAIATAAKVIQMMSAATPCRPRGASARVAAFDMPCSMIALRILRSVRS
jgi:hypothetical protein